MKTPRLLVLALFVVLAVASSAKAGWGWMPSFNPFKKKDSHPANIEADHQEAGWHWLGSSNKPAPKETGPSMWQRMSGGTKNAWTKTRSVLTPWRSKPPEEEELVITGSNSSFSQMANGNSKQPAKKSMWSWGAEEERPQKASSVSDFIGGKRPE